LPGYNVPIFSTVCVHRLPLTFLEEHTASIFRVEEMRSRLCQSV